jgi:hypothetical protein
VLGLQENATTVSLKCSLSISFSHRILLPVAGGASLPHLPFFSYLLSVPQNVFAVKSIIFSEKNPCF